ncbi:MAG TPA: tetratricopeptide repeat protein [Chitinophagaceae bacterium]|nr:tetratricopeptide repeat protein [Chitinophagaceae bacterium]
MRKPVFIIALLLSFLFLGSTDLHAQNASTAAPDTSGPRTFAMIMGISNYKYIRPLNYADKDAELFRDFMKSPGEGNLPDDHVYCLLNEDAKAANFWVKGMAWLKSKNLKKGDRLFIYLAGHGDAIDQDEYFFLTYDCNPAGDKNNYIVTGNVPLFFLKNRIADFTAKGVDVFFIMDACRSNELPGGREGQQALNQAISEKRAGEVIMLATGAGQESLEDATIGSGHGLFTYYLVDGMAGVADSSGDNKVTVTELQRFVDKYVPAIAAEKYKRQQDPFFCCADNEGKIISIVDTAYMRKWMISKQLKPKGGGNSYFSGGREIRFRSVPHRANQQHIDSSLLETYNLFNKAVKESRLTGDSSAEYYYDQLEKKYPGNSYTIDAQQTLSVEFINFAQTKINLYLECKDVASIQKIRSQIDEGEKSDEISVSLDRMERVAREEFFEVGKMLEKAIALITPDDPDFAKSLMGRMYFFKAFGYFGKERRLMDINQAFQYAYTAYAADKKAAYILNTLASLHLDNNRMDSAVYYSRLAIGVAPQWRYPYVNLAYAYKSLNKVDSALKYYHRAIAVDPGNADAYVDLGHYYYSLSRADSAIANYRRALQLEPGNVYASNNIGWLYHDKKRSDSAIYFFKQSIAADPKFINAYNGLAKTFFELKQYDSARIYYASAFANYKDKSIVNIYIGNFYRDLKQYDSALAYYRLSVQYDPNYEESYNDMGRIFFAMKQFDSAKASYRKALEVNPYSAFSLINIGLVFREQKQKDSTYAYFHRAVHLEPANPGILNNLGVIYAQDNLKDSAKVYFKRALEIKPDYTTAYNNLVKLFNELKQYDSLTNFLKTSSQYDPNSIQFFDNLGQVFLGQKRYDSARYYYSKAIQVDPSNSILYNNMSLIFIETRQYDSAKIYLQKAALLDPENNVVAENLARVFRQLKEPDSAAFYYKKQLFDKVENNAQAFGNLGLFYMEMKAYDSAIAYFKIAVQMDPSYIAGYNNIGASYINMEETDSAFAYYRQAVNLDSTYPNAALNLGLLYHSLRKYDSAISYLNKAIRLNPSNGRTYYRLACSYALNNQPENAVSCLKQAFEKGFKNYDVLINDPDLGSLKDNKEFQSLGEKYLKKKDQ